MNPKDVQKMYMRNKLSPIEAAQSIADLVPGPMNVANYKPGMKFKVGNENGFIDLQYTGYNARQMRRNEALAAALYQISKDNVAQNPDIRPEGVHISKRAASRDHGDGLQRILKKYRR